MTMDHDNLAVLQDLNWDGTALTLRLDPNVLTQHDNDMQMTILTLYKCQLPQHTLDTLIYGIGKVFQYDVDQEDQGSVFQFFINYWADEVEVLCQRWSEIRVACTTADLIARSKYLAARYAASLKHYARLEQQYNVLRKFLN